MPLHFSKARRFFCRVFGVLAVLAAVYVPLASIGLIWSPWFCIVEERSRIEGVSGYDFAVIETDCATLGSNPTTRVFVSRHGRSKKTLLLEYDSARWDILPVITATGPNTVLISISAISTLFFYRDGLKGLSVQYDIGKIDYPVDNVRHER